VWGAALLLVLHLAPVLVSFLLALPAERCAVAPGAAGGAPAVRIDRMGPDNYWFGARPQILLNRRGAGVDGMFARVRDAVASYPYPRATVPGPDPTAIRSSRRWPGRSPDLAIHLPSNAVGKDFLPGGGLFAAAPSGSGFQLLLGGLFGILLAAREGLEVNLLGLSPGVDPVRPALKLPALGRLGIAGL
jgi:hypothetical protein